MYVTGEGMEGFVGWPDDTSALYREKGYWEGITIGQMLDRSSKQYASRIALVYGDQKFRYAELGPLVDRLAAHLIHLGTEPDQKVILQLPNCLEFVVSYFACLKVGAIPLSCLPALRQGELQHFAALLEAVAYFFPMGYRGFQYLPMARGLQSQCPSLKYLFSTGGSPEQGVLCLGRLMEEPVGEELLRELADRGGDPCKPAVFLLSGGTTGMPKVIPRTHDDFLYASRASAEGTGLCSDSAILLCLPLTHVLPLACPGLQGAFRVGARVILASSPDPAVVFPLIERERVTYCPVVPTVLISWINSSLRSHYDLSSLKSLPTGGMKMTPELARRAYSAFGEAVMQEYGSSEGFICSTRPGDPLQWRYETQGRPISPADEFKIVDEEGREVPPGGVGELVGQGPYTIRGYYRAEDYNRVAFTPDGFYRTGDMFRVHPSGNLVFEGRKKDMINRGGEHFSADEVEGYILGHPTVMNAAVVAMPDPILGEKACAFVILKAEAKLTLQELNRFLSEERQIAKFKLPERLEIVDELPLTPVGKVAKETLRKRIQETRSWELHEKS